MPCRHFLLRSQVERRSGERRHTSTSIRTPVDPVYTPPPSPPKITHTQGVGGHEQKG